MAEAKPKAQSLFPLEEEALYGLPSEIKVGDRQYDVKVEGTRKGRFSIDLYDGSKRIGNMVVKVYDMDRMQVVKNDAFPYKVLMDGVTTDKSTPSGTGAALVKMACQIALKEGSETVAFKVQPGYRIGGMEGRYSDSTQFCQSIPRKIPELVSRVRIGLPEDPFSKERQGVWILKKKAEEAQGA